VTVLRAQGRIVQAIGTDHRRAEVLGCGIKGKISFVICVAGTGLVFVNRWLGFLAYVLPTSLWLIPDRRIERALAES
jgi:hypothetical protein